MQVLDKESRYPDGWRFCFAQIGGGVMAKRRGQSNRYGADEMREKVEEYFAETEAAGRMPSVGGLALHLGFTSRQALQRYIDGSAADKTPLRDCVDIITRARSRIEEANVQALYDRDKTRGAQFVLQNGFGYTEKQEIRHDAVINVQITDE